MLFSEQLRVLNDEEVLVNDTTEYAINSTTNWVTVTSKNIVLSKQKFVYVRICFSISATNGSSRGNARVLLNNQPLLGGGRVLPSDANADVSTIILLDVGSYTFDFQLAGVVGSGYVVKYTLIKISTFNFPDKNKFHYNSGWVQVGTSQTTIINLNITAPSSRKLAAGKINKYTVLVDAYFEVENLTVSIPRNSTEPDGTSYNWRIFVNNVGKNWIVKRGDLPASSYGPGSLGRCVFTLNPSETCNLKITVTNTYDGNTRNVRAVVYVVLCPWIIPNEAYTPLIFNFPQGSTLYVVLEPLNSNPTKTFKIGKVRCESFGDSTDYYYSISGTGILTAYYTFEFFDVENVQPVISGYGGCISVIAVDVR